MVGNQKVILNFWDTAGQERFRSIAPVYYRDADAVMLLYDITREVLHSTFLLFREHSEGESDLLIQQQSIASVQYWLIQLQSFLADNRVSLMIIGNKIDWYFSMVSKAAGSHSLFYSETFRKVTKGDIQRAINNRTDVFLTEISVRTAPDLTFILEAVGLSFL